MCAILTHADLLAGTLPQPCGAVLGLPPGSKVPQRRAQDRSPHFGSFFSLVKKGQADKTCRHRVQAAGDRATRPRQGHRAGRRATAAWLHMSTSTADLAAHSLHPLHFLAGKSQHPQTRALCRHQVQGAVDRATVLC